MAFRIIRAYELIGKPLKNICVANNGLTNPTTKLDGSLLRTHAPVTCVTRNTSFFNKLPAEDLWKGVTSVSNAGKKRGRGKGAGKKMAKNLNRGQVIGVGKANVLWPGLTVPVMRGRELVQQQQLPEDPEREAKLVKLRNEMGGFRFAKISPLDRGWSGTKMPGRSIGPPDPIGEDAFEGFDTKVLEMKTVINMKGNLGRKRRLSVFAVTGNGNGLAGFALGKAVDTRAALKRAKNRAGQKLMNIPRYKKHTVLHDFFSAFGRTKVYVTKKQEGHGLICHRAIKTCCEVIGIKDLHAKVEGPTNLQHIIKAFFLGLIQQKSYTQIAEEKSLHLVELRKEQGNFPLLLASPTSVRKPQEVKSSEILDFSQHVMGGRVVLRKKKFPPFYTKHRSWSIRVRKQEYIRNQDQVRVRMLAEHGELCSFLTEKYPEARPPVRGTKKKMDQEAEA